MREGRFDAWLDLRREIKVKARLSDEDAGRLALEMFPPLPELTSEEQKELAEATMVLWKKETIAKLGRIQRGVDPDEKRAAQEEKQRVIDEQLRLLAVATSDDNNFDRDWEWAYSNMAIPDIMPVAAPSASAWGLWQFAQENRVKFVEKYLSSREKRRGEEGATSPELLKDRKTRFAVIDRLLEHMVQDARRAIGDLIRLCPEVVVDELQKVGWHVISEKEAAHDLGPGNNEQHAVSVAVSEGVDSQSGVPEGTA